jgi:hypothetical protein
MADDADAAAAASASAPAASDSEPAPAPAPASASEEAPAAGAGETEAAHATDSGAGADASGTGGDANAHADAVGAGSSSSSSVTKEQPTAQPAIDDKTPPLRIEEYVYNANVSSLSMAKGTRTAMVLNAIYSNKKGAKFTVENITRLLNENDVSVCFRGRTRAGEWLKGSVKMSFKGQPVLDKVGAHAAARRLRV